LHFYAIDLSICKILIPYYRSKRLRFVFGHEYPIVDRIPVLQLQNAEQAASSPSLFSVNCFFGIGLQATDFYLIPLKYRRLTRALEVFKKA
jgi:hypothetical protein